MKKLRLDLDALEVESFATTPSDSNDAKGTIHGYQPPTHNPKICDSLDLCESEFGSCFTCQVSCNGTCGGSCGGTCGGNTCASCHNFTCHAHCTNHVLCDMNSEDVIHCR